MTEPHFSTSDAVLMETISKRLRIRRKLTLFFNKVAAISDADGVSILQLEDKKSDLDSDLTKKLLCKACNSPNCHQLPQSRKDLSAK